MGKEGGAQGREPGVGICKGGAVMCDMTKSKERGNGLTVYPNRIFQDQNPEGLQSGAGCQPSHVPHKLSVRSTGATLRLLVLFHGGAGTPAESLMQSKAWQEKSPRGRHLGCVFRTRLRFMQEEAGLSPNG